MAVFKDSKVSAYSKILIGKSNQLLEFRVYTSIAEEFYRIKTNGEIIKENLSNFVKLSTQQSVNFIRNKFWYYLLR